MLHTRRAGASLEPTAVSHFTETELHTEETVLHTEETVPHAAFERNTDTFLNIAPTVGGPTPERQGWVESLKRPLRTASILSVGAALTHVVAPQVGLGLWAAPVVIKMVATAASITSAFLLTYAPQRTVWTLAGSLIGAAVGLAVLPAAPLAAILAGGGLGAVGGYIGHVVHDQMELMMLCAAIFGVLVLISSRSGPDTN